MKTALLNLNNTFNCIDNNILRIDELGLMGGNVGVALQSLYFAIFADDKRANERFGILLGQIGDNLENERQYSFCSGLAGIGWFYQFMNDEGYFENDTNVLLEDFDLYLATVLKLLMEENDTDFLHGATGIAYYFYCRSKDNPKANDVLRGYVNALAKIVETEGNSIKLATKDFKTKETIYNISLSHGMSAVVSVLARIYTIEALRTGQLKQLIEGMVNYILAQEIDKDKYGSYYPYTSIESSKETHGSRLAWCYGDLGVGTALYQVGMIMNRQDWIDKAITVLLYSAQKRRDLPSNLVMDACLCHGTAGIGQIFYRMWWDTRIPEFKNAADYWFAETLKMAKFEDGLAGYKTWQGAERGFRNEYGLLEGIAGIGLALTSYTYETEPTWDECLLLS